VRRERRRSGLELWGLLVSPRLCLLGAAPGRRPITIALETYDGSSFGNVLPLYVEIKGYADSLGCTPEGAGQVIFITRSLDTCGGVWESVGPVEITRFTPLGSFYRIQVAFLQAYPPHWDIRSPALRCIRVTVAPDAIASTSWSNLKILFR